MFFPYTPYMHTVSYKGDIGLPNKDYFLNRMLFLDLKFLVFKSGIALLTLRRKKISELKSLS